MRVAAFSELTKLGRLAMLVVVVVGAVVVVVVVATGVADAALDAEPVPTELLAVTDMEYDVPFSNPEIAHDVVAVEHVEPDDVDAVYSVIADPPSSAGAVHDTVICPSPASSDTAVGCPGTPGVRVTVIV